jgi:hypothetical protein
MSNAVPSASSADSDPRSICSVPNCFCASGQAAPTACSAYAAYVGAGLSEATDFLYSRHTHPASRNFYGGGTIYDWETEGLRERLAEIYGSTLRPVVREPRWSGLIERMAVRGNHLVERDTFTAATGGLLGRSSKRCRLQAVVGTWLATLVNSICLWLGLR